MKNRTKILTKTFAEGIQTDLGSATNSSSGLIFVKIRAESGRIFNKNPGKNPGEMLICKEFFSSSFVSKNGNFYNFSEINSSF